MNRKQRRSINKRLIDQYKTEFENTRSFAFYKDWLKSIYLTLYEWEGLDDLGVDPRFTELGLLEDAHMLFFEDDVLEKYLCLRCNLTGNRDFYDVPKARQAYSNNGYSNSLDDNNSVVIFSNYTRRPDILTIYYYAKKLEEIDRAIDVNVRGQKTPKIIQVNSEKQMLTLTNALKQVDDNASVIFTDKSLSPEQLKSIDITTPYVADKLYDLKVKTWNEALMRIGVPNVNIEKKERLLQREIINSQGGAIASRFAGLASRQYACKQIKEMYGLNIWVDYRDEFKEGFITTQLSQNITPKDIPDDMGDN